MLELAGGLCGHLVLNGDMGLPGLRVLPRELTAGLCPCLATPSFEFSGPYAEGNAEAEKDDAVEAKFDWSARPLDGSKTCDLGRRQLVEQREMSGKDIPLRREVFAPETVEPGEAHLVHLCREDIGGVHGAGQIGRLSCGSAPPSSPCSAESETPRSRTGLAAGISF